MIRNYITIALRSMMRNKVYMFINIFALSVGVACCVLLSFYINVETSKESENRVMRTSAPAYELPETPMVRHRDKRYESDGFTADSTQLDISPYQFRSRNPKKALV